MIQVKPTKNYKICKKCEKQSVRFEGNWQRCFSCGEVYSKREHILDDIVIDKEMSKRVKYINKMFFFLTA